MESESK